MEWFVDLYLRDGDPTDPRISPHFASDDDLAAACPAHVIIAGYDPLADEGAAYAERLRDAGVPVTVARYDGQMHGFVTMGTMIPTGAAALDEAIEYLRTALGSAADDRPVSSGTERA
jgi:acetyl esterase